MRAKVLHNPCVLEVPIKGEKLKSGKLRGPPARPLMQRGIPGLVLGEGVRGHPPPPLRVRLLWGRYRQSLLSARHSSRRGRTRRELRPDRCYFFSQHGWAPGCVRKAGGGGSGTRKSVYQK